MKTIDLLKYEAVAKEAMARAVKQFRFYDHESAVRWKNEHDFSTSLDFQIERDLREFLLAQCPETDFLGEEESAATKLKDAVWVLDPIDGTVNFSRGSPLCGISLALMMDGEAVVSRVCFPLLGLEYRAIKGGGAYRNDREISVSQSSSVNKSIISVGDFAVRGDIERRNSQRLKLLSLISGQCLRVRMIGSAALDLCMVADGTHDACMLLSNNPWDVHGGILIVREAGGEVYDARGDRHSPRSGQTLSSNRHLKPEISHLAMNALEN